ncbi:sulfite exporter TauE/SafE family protein [Breznakiella homolactica]|uniref:Probable membrane transporter protein n=1 Tax=Breznakiella homolactica TaxID=2798577 RepID=A0A7T7XPP7_9SPIR|nr:sulfite exporter TauE/SafE family protein [Breznakiella homolactica]QQO10225.1 sulfite exporter TauE/SafE family protein [Breznakiella homolactica]
MTVFVFFIISLSASVIGAVCGIGGGVIIKPCLDIFNLAGIATISFLSSSTVLAMTTYSVARTLISRDGHLNMKIATPLAAGAALGGVLGQELFRMLRAFFAGSDRIGAVQAVCLGIMTLGTLVYTVKKKSIPTHQVKNAGVCILIGFLLGLVSSFLGIGGGPMNLVVLYYFFSMDTKSAVHTSLYLIFFSQLMNILSTVVTGTVPDFDPLVLVTMIAGGIGGGIIGRGLHKRIRAEAVERLFIGLMAVIIGISVYNAIQYSGLFGG